MQLTRLRWHRASEQHPPFCWTYMPLTGKPRAVSSFSCKDLTLYLDDGSAIDKPRRYCNHSQVYRRR